MVSYLDCIYRIPEIINRILDNREETFKALKEALTEKKVNEIFLIGSGTSNTSSVTACRYVEKASGLPASAVLPNEFLSKHAYNENACYVFVSQSGTSTLTQKALLKVKEKGCLTVSISEKADTPLSKIADVFVDMGCGYEEYGMRTIGYCSTILTEMVMGMEIGKLYGNLSEEEYNAALHDAREVPASHKEICDAALKWFDRNKEDLMSVDSYALYGSGSLWGVALEGALKILEVAKRFLCVGYEMDDGLHGPTMGFTKKHGIIILNDGGKDNHLAMGLAKYIKNEVGHAYVIGKNALDEADLPFEMKGNDFKCLEFAPVVEILAYRLAVDHGIVLQDIEHQEPLPEMKYFNTHDE